MLDVLLALNVDMVEQLQLERLGTDGGTALLSGMIEEHENAAAMLRLQIGYLKAGAATNGATDFPVVSGKRIRRSAGALRVGCVGGLKPAVNGITNGVGGPH